MKHISKLFFAIILMMAFAACKKEPALPSYQNGTAITLNASTNSIAPAPGDSNSVALTLTWTYPDYATDSSNMKYIIQIDSANGNFSNPASRTVLKSLSTSFTAKELNTILLSYGYDFGVAYDMKVRALSSYVNNNEQLASNILNIQMTPYKIPPKVTLPASGRLFIVGDATDFGWTNDAAPPFPAVREFTQLSETLWAGIFNMHGSGGYKILQTQGNWDTQFHQVTGDALSGTFVQENADPAFSSPPAGPYMITLDFQSGTYILSKLDNSLSPDLYITGDAVPSNWTNSPPENQKFTEITNGVFEITMAFTPGKYYKFLSSYGNWQPQFGGNSATGGNLGANFGGGSDPDAVPTPADAGNYKIQVNFINNTYTVTKL